MALVKCSECGKEISDKSTTCIHCGYPFNAQEIQAPCDVTIETQSEERRDANSLKLLNLLKHKKVIAAVLVLFLVIVGVATMTSNSFSSDESYALRIVNKYQDMLKNPESLVLRSDVVVISYSHDGDIDTYVFFDASGENSYGASVRSIPCFVDGRYLCDSDEFPTTEEYVEMDEVEAKKYLGAEIAFSGWKLYGEEATEKMPNVIESYSVSAEKIARKLKIDTKIN